MAKVDNIADLHDEVLELLLEYKRENDSDLTFRLRPYKMSQHKKQLSKGLWFKIQHNSRYAMIISFTKKKEVNGGSNIGLIHIEINEDKELNFSFGESLIYEELGRESDELYAKFIKNVGNFRMSHFSNINNPDLSFNENIKLILKKIDKFLNSTVFLEQEYYTSIPQEEFQKNLNYILKKRSELKEKKKQELLLHSNIKERVFIKDFSIEDYYEIKEASIKELPKNASWVFLTGENGAGKSLVLQALAIGLYGNKEDNIVPKNDKVLIDVTYQSQGKAYKNQVKQGKIHSLPYLACFGPIRLDVQTEGSENNSSKRSTATYSLFGNYDALFKNIETELKFAFYENEKKYEILVNMLKSVVPSLAKIKFDRTNRAIKYFEKSKDNSTYKAVSFSELATGIKSIIAMVGDIYLRFSTLMQKNNRTDKYLSPEELYGIVIIDELDLHLHPTWQKRFPTLFSEVFPNIQFIASTHSAIPILGAPKGSVLLKVNRTAEKGITVERLKHLEAQLENLTPNLILTSEIFGLQDIFPITHQPDKRIRTENTMEELKENDEMLDALKSYMDTDKEDELLKLFAK